MRYDEHRGDGKEREMMQRRRREDGEGKER
jgi:hypothetical protein